MFGGVNRLKTDAFYVCVTVNYHFSNPFDNYISGFNKLSAGGIYANLWHRSSQGKLGVSY